jgi:hypothetical protein
MKPPAPFRPEAAQAAKGKKGAGGFNEKILIWHCTIQITFLNRLILVYHM